jgi:FecR protein
MTMHKIQAPIFAMAVLACSLVSVLSFADSQVRIVRLSGVEGGVQINRNTQSYEKAFVNLPITQGNQVRTLSDGRAEIEFEDGSMLRMAPHTALDFSQLSLSDSGTRMSNVDLKAGTTYVDFRDAKKGQLTIVFGHEKITFARPAHLRIELSDQGATVAVFSGEADVEAPSGTVQVSKNRTAIFDLAANDASKLARNIEPNPYDEWDKQQSRYQQSHSDSVLANSTSYSYGLTDLSYYGSYFNSPGYGLMWQPYFAGVGWDPFMDGAWAFYPGAGYGWVSAYPWGWMPYHSGSWAFIGGRGWAWQPGGPWMALNTLPQVRNAPAGFSAPRPPATAGQSLVVVNRGPTPTFAGRSTSKLIIQNNSAGLGIPRGEVNNLARASQQANTQGMVTARIHTAPVQMAPVTAWGSQTQTPGSGSRGLSSSPSPYAGGHSNEAPARSAGSSTHSASAGREPSKN